MTQESQAQAQEANESPLEDLQIDITERDKAIAKPEVVNAAVHAQANPSPKNKSKKEQDKQESLSLAHAKDQLEEYAQATKTKSKAKHPWLLVTQKLQEKPLGQNETLFLSSAVILLLMGISGIQFLFGFMLAWSWTFAIGVCGLMLWQKRFFALPYIALPFFALLGAHYGWDWSWMMSMISVGLLSLVVAGLYQLMMKNNSVRRQ